MRSDYCVKITTCQAANMNRKIDLAYAEIKYLEKIEIFLSNTIFKSKMILRRLADNDANKNSALI